VSHRRVFVLGGARSGKSAFAERLAVEGDGPVIYVATASAGDDEMAERIARHRAQRPAAWRTVEAPTGLADRVATALREVPRDDSPVERVTVLVEDLTLLLANLMADDESQAEARGIAEVRQLMALSADLILVSNEVGMGVVPPYPLGRRFRDALGRLNQSTAAASDAVYMLFAGLPLQLK
jgi:adenosylcobinamide kinase/adenosylcobinamide-phosphate guanylyltransferase